MPPPHADLVRLLEAEDARVERERLLHVGRAAGDEIEVHSVDRRALAAVVDQARDLHAEVVRGRTVPLGESIARLLEQLVRGLEGGLSLLRVAERVLVLLDAVVVFRAREREVRGAARGPRRGRRLGAPFVRRGRRRDVAARGCAPGSGLAGEDVPAVDELVGPLPAKTFASTGKSSLSTALSR